MPALQTKRWSFTVNNYSPEEMQHLIDLSKTSSIRYIVIGKEVGESGTPHLQGYVETSKKMSMGGIKKLVNSRAHFEISKGSAQENRTYCLKDNNPLLEKGKPVIERQRTDLEDVKEDIDNGVAYSDLWDKHFSLMVRYRKSFEEYGNIKRLGSRTMPKVYIWWGRTGTGKTRGAFDMAAAEFNDSYWVWPGGAWFDGYRGERVAIFDEFHGGEDQGISFSLWKKLCDRYPLTVPVKGSFTNWSPEIIILTSNVDPSQWWPKEMKPLEWKDQFNRRIFEIKEFS